MALEVKAFGSAPFLARLLEGVALLGVEHLVLEIVGDPGGGIQPLAIERKAHVHAAVAGGKEARRRGV